MLLPFFPFYVSIILPVLLIEAHKTTLCNEKILCYKVLER